MMDCPYCQGTGVIKNYNMPVVIGLMGVLLVVILAVFLLV